MERSLLILVPLVLTGCPKSSPSDGGGASDLAAAPDLAGLDLAGADLAVGDLAGDLAMAADGGGCVGMQGETQLYENTCQFGEGQMYCYYDTPPMGLF